jgi:multiple sugar transport system substrate-binding protein
MRRTRRSRLGIVAVGLSAVALAVVPALAGAHGTHARGAKDVTLTYWNAYDTGSPEETTIENVVIPGFEASHPGITVKSVNIPYDDLHQKLLTATAGGDLPDVVRSDIIWVPELAQLGVLAPLDQDLADFKALSKKVYPGALATNLYKGHYYGFPLDTNTRVLMYNDAALKAAGIKHPPATFAALTAMAPKLKAKGISAFADSGTSGWNLFPWIWSAGGEVTNASNTKATGYLNSPASVAGVQLLVNLYKGGDLPKLILGDKGSLQTSDGLPKGKYATILDGPWMYPQFTTSYPKFVLHTAPVPAGPGGSISVVGGEDIVMTNATPNKAAAEQFIDYMLSPATQLAMAKVGQMSVRTDLVNQMLAIHPYYKAFMNQLKTARPRIPTPQYPKIESIISTDVQQAFLGKQTVQQALTNAAKQIDPLLAAPAS